ncbi:hypothetical protein J2Z76_003325 [Sedimentibacter acidaminivorans]|uniref:4Fe-4S ferredoxin-type domain-containing protein n=1 Tax=Sedimentibacter acidaminivorans TaxID=913099 RepID=A0ABS4GIB0_9FIRM|nr:hypothetical protein [Sedimentibacter acidaminivorans]MBP1927423.1 hypothetical protein [Sedimentibacter acidaminivorans]
MGKVIIESNYRRFDPVGQSEMCENCPSSCKTSCARMMMANHDIDEEQDFKDFEDLRKYKKNLKK